MSKTGAPNDRPHEGSYYLPPCTFHPTLPFTYTECKRILSITKVVLAPQVLKESIAAISEFFTLTLRKHMEEKDAQIIADA